MEMICVVLRSWGVELPSLCGGQKEMERPLVAGLCISLLLKPIRKLKEFGVDRAVGENFLQSFRKGYCCTRD